MDEMCSRRALLQNGVALGALAVFGVGCSKQAAPTALSCADTTGLPPADVSMRTSLAYVDTSVEPGNMCSNCQLFIPSSTANSCGTCKVVKGSINPNGYCKSYVAKPA